jgi:hypothetical protein
MGFRLAGLKHSRAAIRCQAAGEGKRAIQNPRVQPRMAEGTIEDKGIQRETCIKAEHQFAAITKQNGQLPVGSGFNHTHGMNGNPQRRLHLALIQAQNMGMVVNMNDGACFQ